MDTPLTTLKKLAARELDSPGDALAALEAAEAADPVPAPGTVEPHLPARGTTVGLHRLYARALAGAGREDEAVGVLTAVAERLNQAGLWAPLARVAAELLEAEPHLAAPLVARARARGGEAAVDRPLLERAHRLMPGHGVLGWLLAEAQAAAGETAPARKSAAGALPELVAEKNYDEAESALLLLVEDPPPDAAPVIGRSLETLARQEAWDRFDGFLALAEEILASPRGAPVAWPVIRELWRRHPGHDSLRPAAIRVARVAFAGYPEPEAVLRISEIERPSQPPEVVLERLRLAEHFPPGYYARHFGWGIGRIRDNDTEALVVDFPAKPMHRMGMATALQALTPLPPDDLRVMLAHDREAVVRLAAEDPGTLVVKALGVLKDGAGTTDEIRKILVPEVVASAAWSGWWKGAQPALASDPRVDAHAAYENRYRLAGDEGEPETVPLPAWDASRDVLKNLGHLDTFLAHHPDQAGRLLESVGERIEDLAAGRRDAVAVAAGLWLLTVDPERKVHPENRVAPGLDLNRLPRTYQEALLPRLTEAPALAAALDSRLAGIRRGAWERLRDRPEMPALMLEMLADAAAHAEAALFLLEDGSEGAPGRGDPLWSGGLLLALLDLLEHPPRESVRKRALALLAADSPLAARLRAAPPPEEIRGTVQSRLRHWQSSDRFRFPVLDFLRRIGLDAVAEVVEGARARSVAKVGERMDAGTEDPYAGSTLLTRPTLERLRQERQRVGMELKTTIPQAIQRARELGDLKENAEYDAAKAKQAAFAKRFEELEALLDGIRLIEDLEREDGVAAPGTEIRLEGAGGEGDLVVWLLGEGDQDLAEGVVSYLAPVGQALLGRRRGETVTLPRDGGSAAYRIASVQERIP